MSIGYCIPKQGFKDKLFQIITWFFAGVITFVFLWILFDLIRYGLQGFSWTFLTQPVEKAGRAGGIFPIITSTLIILGISLAVSIPLGLGTALFLSEFIPADSFLAITIGRSLDILAAVPSIVFGLFGNVFFCLYLKMGYSLLSGGLTLALMVLPIFIRAVEVGFRSTPEDYRLAGYALGMSRIRIAFSILLPVAMPAVIVGLILGIGRALAETAALLFTSGYVDRMPESLLDSGRTLSIHIYELAMNVPGGEANAYTSALVLIVLLLGINIIAAWISDHWLKGVLEK